jgi:hypothetical protein
MAAVIVCLSCLKSCIDINLEAVGKDKTRWRLERSRICKDTHWTGLARPHCSYTSQHHCCLVYCHNYADNGTIYCHRQ